MHESRWRMRARQVIAPVLAAGYADEAELRRKISAAYPFGVRKYHPYKIWLEEVRLALGEQRKKEDAPSEEPQGRLL